MATFLFDKTIFGPVKSRRLGVSLGINLLPNSRKVCNFNCIYCECGWTPQKQGNERLPSALEVTRQLEAKLLEMSSHSITPDVITFAGNGEPTLHPDFYKITSEVIRLRNQYCPEAKIALLSNATTLKKKGVIEAMQKIDKYILKLDSGIEKTCIRLNKPIGKFSLSILINQLKGIHKKLTIQTLFIKGMYEGELIDNTSMQEIDAWLKLIDTIKPEEVMVYTIDRDTPVKGLTKVPLPELKRIALLVEERGFKATVSS